MNDKFEVYRCDNNGDELLASKLSIQNTVLFIEAWFEANYSDVTSTLEVRRVEDPYIE